MTPVRRELTTAVLLCLVGSVVVLAAASRTWAEVALPGDALRAGSVAGASGGDLVPGVRALGLVGLAGVVALAATRRRGRAVVGVLVSLAGLATAVESVRAALDLPGRIRTSSTAADLVGAGPVTGTAWPWVCAAGGLVLLAAGALVAVRGPRWAALSSRYEPPAAPVVSATGDKPGDKPGDKELWEELDRGEDPTRG